MNYYEHELGKLQGSSYPFSVQLYDGLGNKTKTLDLNRESVPVIIEWMKKNIM